MYSYTYIYIYIYIYIKRRFVQMFAEATHPGVQTVARGVQGAPHPLVLAVSSISNIIS